MNFQFLFVIKKDQKCQIYHLQIFLNVEKMDEDKAMLQEWGHHYIISH